MRILFVDDEPNVLAGLRRMLHEMRGEWSMEFAPSGAEALAACERAPFDVVVTDMRMPHMDGATLLGHVKQRWPATVRIVLSGNVERTTLLRSVETAHQHLSKPCDPVHLKSAIVRATRLRDVLTDATLATRLAQVDAIPSVPDVYRKMVAKVNDANVSVRDIGDVVGEDVAMTARVLQIVNSAFFVLPRHVGSPGEAAVLLGLDVLRSLVLATHVFRSATPEAAAACRLHDLQHHSHLAGMLSRQFAQRIGLDHRQQDEAFLAGTLHDVGHLMLAQLDPARVAELFGRTSSTFRGSVDDERAEFGTDHARAGAYLLGAWGLPVSIVEAVAFHHEPTIAADAGRSTTTCVHVAEATLAAIDDPGIECTARADHDYLAALDLADVAAEFIEEMKVSTPVRS